MIEIVLNEPFLIGSCLDKELINLTIDFRSLI